MTIGTGYYYAKDRTRTQYIPVSGWKFQNEYSTFSAVENYFFNLGWRNINTYGNWYIYLNTTGYIVKEKWVISDLNVCGWYYTVSGWSGSTASGCIISYMYNYIPEIDVSGVTVPSGVVSIPKSGKREVDAEDEGYGL